MTDEHRKRIFDVLLADAAKLPVGDVTRTQLEDCARGTLELLDPVLDQIIREEKETNP